MTPSQIIHALMKKGLTRYRISKETGLGESTLHRWINDKSVPDKDKLDKLKKYYENIINKID